MISGIHLATALSVMLHMEQEGNEMDTKEIKVRLDNLIDDWEMLEPRSDWYDWQHDIVRAAERLSEQQQVIYELFAVLTYVRNRIEKSEEWWMDCPDRGGFDTDIIDLSLSRAKGHTKDDE